MANGPQENDLLKPTPGKRVRKVPAQPSGEKATPAFWAQEAGINLWQGAMRRAGIAPDAEITSDEFNHAVEQHFKVVMY
jgi:hypothetical protein